jgi:hypothetical protein
MAQAALYAYTAVYVTRLHEVLGGVESLRLPLILGLICAIFVVVTPRATKRNVLRRAEVKAVLGLGLIALVSIPLSVWPGGSLDFVVDSYSRVLAFYVFVIILATSAAQLRGVVMAFIAGGGVLGLATALELQSVSWQTGPWARAYAGDTYDPNELAMLMVCLLPFALYGAMFARGWPSRAFMATVAVIAVLAVVKTVSRAGFLGLVGVVALILVRIWRGGNRRWAGGLAALALGASLMVPGTYWQVMRTVFATEAEDEDYLGAGVRPRWEIWKEGLALFVRNPLTGAGIGQFEVGYGVARDGGKWSAAHNSFIQIGAETGMVGLALFVWLLVRAFRNAHLVARRARTGGAMAKHGWMACATEASLAGYVICGSALSAAYSPVLYLLLALSLVLALQAGLEPQRERAQPEVLETAGGRGAT